MDKLQHQMQISRLKRRINEIEKIHQNPNIIHIYGYDYLQSIPGEHWTNRIKNLWKDAGLLSYYVLEMYCDETPSKRISIELVSYPVKLFVTKRLKHFVHCQNKSHLIIIQ